MVDTHWPEIYGYTQICDDPVILVDTVSWEAMTEEQQSDMLDWAFRGQFLDAEPLKTCS